MRLPLGTLFLTTVASLRPSSSKHSTTRALTLAALLLVVLALGAVTEANAQSPQTISDVVIFATNSAELNTDVNVLSGDIVVNDVSPGPTLKTGVELVLDRKAMTAVGVTLKAHRILIKKQVVVAGDVFFNELDNQGTIDGNEFFPLALPVFDPLPPFQQAVLPPGVVDIDVPDDGTLDLPAGDYGDIRVGNDATIRFLGGLYNVRSIDAGGGSKVLFVNASDVRIEGRFLTGNDAEVRPEDGSGIGASDIIFYVNGTNSGDLLQNPVAAKTGLRNVISANFYVPNGTLRIKNAAIVEGAFLGRDVLIEKNTQVTLNSFFSGRPLPVGDPPPKLRADPQNVFTDGANDLEIILTGSDPEGGTLTFSTSTLAFPLLGTLSAPVLIIPADVGRCSVSGDTCQSTGDCSLAEDICEDLHTPPVTSASVTYSPATGDDEENSFTFTVTDPESEVSEPALIQINPQDPAGSLPDVTVVSVADVTAETLTNTPVTITLEGEAPDGVDLTFSIVSGSGPTSGSLSGVTQVPPTNATVDYAPNEFFEGDDSFQFMACGVINETEECATATATIGVDVETLPEPDPDTVTLDDQTVPTDENTAVEVTLMAETSTTGAGNLFRIAGKTPAASLLPSSLSKSSVSRLIAYFPFNENADDESGNGLDGTVKGGATLTTDRFDNANSAYSFCDPPQVPCVNQNIAVSDNNLLDIAGDISVAAWMYPTAEETQKIIRKGYFRAGDGLPPPFELGLSKTGGPEGEGEIVFNLTLDGVINNQARKTGYTLNAWTFVVGTYDYNATTNGGTIKLYVDGQLETTKSVSGTMTPDTTTLVIGSSFYSNETFRGKLDDLRIYDGALTETEIQELFGEGPEEPESTPGAVFEVLLSVSFPIDQQTQEVIFNGSLTYTDENGRIVTIGQDLVPPLPNGTILTYLPDLGSTGDEFFVTAQLFEITNSTFITSTQATVFLTVGTSLPQNFPNPFNPSTTITFTVPEASYVKLAVYDVLGRKVRVLVEGTHDAGTHKVVFDASGLPSGTYFTRLETRTGVYTKSMLLLK